MSATVSRKHTACRRVMFCTIGSSPAIATETVWSLCHQRKPAWIPDALHVVTTADGLRRVVDGLHPSAPGLEGLMPDGAPLPTISVHVPRRGQTAIVIELAGSRQSVEPALVAAEGDATALKDVATSEDNAAMGDLVLAVLSGFAAQADVELHVSLAGGRKTMSAHAQLAMSLVGRPGDEVSHVLVSPVAFEMCPSFWHKGQRIPATARDGRELDIAEATITLVLSPTPWLRTFLPRVDFDRSPSTTLSGLVEQVNRATASADEDPTGNQLVVSDRNDTKR
ncbi:CRISPR-associated ring nuclease Csm6 [Falsiroseomonas sp.]|uniref:CRISPR-associated ring nuclease Csm6 n=1 Tax=Falsiroseomonas sp. TaxID=2870721 RepID=UPI003F726F3E